jgi:hypothetical protein
VRFGFKAERSVMRKRLPKSRLSMREYISLNRITNYFLRRRKVKQFIFVLLVVFCSLFNDESLQADYILYFTSSPTSWVGQGETLTFTSPTTAFSSHRHDNAVCLSFNNGQDWYDLYLIGPVSTLPTVGFYPNATRWPFTGTGPGLWFVGNGRGDNTITGHFNVLQANYDLNGNVVSFAVDFTQYDEGAKANWVAGSFRYNSSIPIPELGTVLLLGLGGLFFRRKRIS